MRFDGLSDGDEYHSRYAHPETTERKDRIDLLTMDASNFDEMHAEVIFRNQDLDETPNSRVPYTANVTSRLSFDNQILTSGITNPPSHTRVFEIEIFVDAELDHYDIDVEYRHRPDATGVFGQ